MRHQPLAQGSTVGFKASSAESNLGKLTEFVPLGTGP